MKASTWSKALVMSLTGIIGSAAVVGVWMIPLEIFAADASVLVCEDHDAQCWRGQAQIQIAEVERLQKTVGDLNQRLKALHSDVAFQRWNRLRCEEAINAMARILKFGTKKEGPTKMQSSGKAGR